MVDPRNRKIVLFTGNSDGGMLQFTLTLLRTLCDLGIDTVCFVPKNASASLSEDYRKRIIRYQTRSSGNRFWNKLQSLSRRNWGLRRIANEICQQSPRLVWLTDNPLVSIEVGLLLCENKIPCMLTLHDGGTFHPGRYSFVNRLKHQRSLRLSHQLETEVGHLLLLSKHTQTIYVQQNPSQTSKIVRMPLGAHLPDVKEKKPNELTEGQRFHLFFGRIDQYKGLPALLEAYNRTPELLSDLVIAGKGTLSEQEKALIEYNPRVHLLNRYIGDDEMIWLIRHAGAVILPYIEATQSGVIPLSYHLGTPVVVSDVPGLTQFVVDGVTGMICHCMEDYQNAMRDMENDEIRARFGKAAREYEKNELNWARNVQTVLREVGL